MNIEHIEVIAMRYYRASLGTLVCLFIFIILFIILIWLIERNYHEDSGSKGSFYGILTVVFGYIGGTIGQATGGISEIIGYFYMFTIIGGYVASEYLFEYNFWRKAILCILSPTALAVSWIIGYNVDRWFGQVLMN